MKDGKEMWQEILNESDLKIFMEKMNFFHDCCIKELRYISGAYINTDLTMHPLNDRRTLSVIIQRQYVQNPMIELEFEGLKFLKLFPLDDSYTCEIIEADMFFQDGYIFWGDNKNCVGNEFNDFEGILLCALKIRWRPLENCMGNSEYFIRKD